MPEATAQHASGAGAPDDVRTEPHALGRAVRAAARFDRRAVSIPAGLLAAIPVVALLGGGLAFLNPPGAVTMGAGAMLVGIAWRTSGGRPPLALMATDSVLMALSTFVGSATGGHHWVHLALLCLWALVGGSLVAAGQRGGVLGTQAILAVIVFGRFSEPPAQALGLAGYVLAGGLGQVLFLTLVRWPAPLRAQRAATAHAYRELAAIAVAPPEASTLPASAALDDAQNALAGGALFADAALLTLRTLVNQGHRLRVHLSALQGLARRHAPTAENGDELSAAAHELTLRVLALTHDALDCAAQAIEGDGQAAGELPAKAAMVGAWAAAAAGPERPGAADRPGAAERSGVAERPGAPDPADPADPADPPDGSAAAEGGLPGLAVPALPRLADRQLARRLAALAGQLRAVATLAPAAGQGGGLRSRRPQSRTNRPLERLRADAALVRANASLDSPAGRHALRLAVVVPLAEIIAHDLPLQRSYWLVVAAATVLRPEFGATFTRGTERALGTALGVALAGAITVGLHPAGAVTVAIVGLLAWTGYAVFPASFAVGFGFITALVVFLLDAIAPDTLATASDRLVDTLIGGAIGLAVYALWPTWSRQPARAALAEVIAAQRAYVGGALRALSAGQRAGEDEMRGLARRARLARTNAESAVATSLADPAGHRLRPGWSQGVLAATRRLVQAGHVLRLDAQERRDRAPVPELAALAADLDTLLAVVERRIAVEPPERPATEPVPDLRADFSALEQAAAGGREVAPLLGELDEIVDAANGLAALVGLDPGQSDAGPGGEATGSRGGPGESDGESDGDGERESERRGGPSAG
jgi:hypothetical protein